MSQSSSATSNGLYPWHAEQWSFFTRCLEMDRLAHALLIEGPSGCGKTALADAMVRKLLCGEDEAVACGRCRSCQLLAGGAHPECIKISYELNEKTGKFRTVLTVDQIRAMISSLQLTKTISRRKVAHIDPADAMNQNAANALLKSLEEPTGADTYLILVTDSPGSLPATIRSRCQSIMVQPPDEEMVREWLRGSTLTPCPNESVDAALRAAGGSPLLALDFLASPELDAFTQVRESLATLLSSPASAVAVSERLAKLSESDTWRWLSSCASEAVRACMRGKTPGWLPANIQLDGKTLLQLQKQADINRRMSTTPVRGDLLLQAWLIGWAEQGI